MSPPLLPDDGRDKRAFQGAMLFFGIGVGIVLALAVWAIGPWR